MPHIDLSVRVYVDDDDGEWDMTTQLERAAEVADTAIRDALAASGFTEVRVSTDAFSET